MILGQFADRELAGMDNSGLDAFERLLDAPDQQVYAWLSEQEAPPHEHDTPTLARIRAFRHEIAPRPQ